MNLNKHNKTQQQNIITLKQKQKHIFNNTIISIYKKKNITKYLNISD